MRLSEITHTIIEGGQSGPRRYNSEIAILCAVLDIDITDFDPAKPEKSIPSSVLEHPEQTYKDIKALLAPNFDSKQFQKWYDTGRVYARVIADKLIKNGDRVRAISWAGGKNQAENAADVGFVGSQSAGISIKAEGGITLANLTPEALGLTPDRGNDIFYHYAQAEYIKMKRKIFEDVLAEAKQSPGKALHFKDPKYNITYDPNTDKFTCKGKNTFIGTDNEIINTVSKNAGWQRVFGDWFQANWQSKKEYAVPLFVKIAKAFEITIEQHLQDSARIKHILRFAKQSYFYISTNAVYYVPSVDEIDDLKLKGLKYAAPDGTSQLFLAQIGRPDSKDFTEVEVYIRYANGMFETNPTVRVQGLRNPQFVGWEKLI